MSYLFAAATDVLSAASAVLTATPITMACWFRSTDNTNNQFVMSLGVSASADNNFSLQARGAVVGDPLRASTRSTSSADADATTAYAINAWQHGCGVFASAADRRSFLNGANKGTNATSKTPAGLNQSRIGLHHDGTTPFKGRIAEAAIWSVALADADVALLAAGVYPPEIQRSSLVSYWPLHDDANDKVGSTNLTVTGATLDSLAPPMRRPPRSRRQLPQSPAPSNAFYA